VASIAPLLLNQRIDVVDVYRRGDGSDMTWRSVRVAAYVARKLCHYRDASDIQPDIIGLLFYRRRMTCVMTVTTWLFGSAMAAMPANRR